MIHVLHLSASITRHNYHIIISLDNNLSVEGVIVVVGPMTLCLGRRKHLKALSFIM